MSSHPILSEVEGLRHIGSGREVTYPALGDAPCQQFIRHVRNIPYLYKQKLFTDILFFIIISLGVLLWGFWIVNTHSSDSIVSWDEGFHGGSALFISQSLRDNFSFREYTYILNDFRNGMIWYPPLWLFLAGPMGAILGPSVEIYRFATLIFALLTLAVIFYFVKSISNYKAAIIACTTLAFTPIFIVYSHLMMREVPNIFGITFPLLLFYKYLTIPKPSPKLLIITALAFALGVWAKITSIVIIFATIFSFGVVIYLFYRKGTIWQRFYSRWTLYFLIIGLLTFNLFRIFTQEILNEDFLIFHLEQTKQLSGNQAGILIVAAKTLFDNITVYLRDFSHMPILTIFWLGSFVLYFIIKRSMLSVYLLVWLIVIYISFSAVKPQAPQYLLPIFAPLSIGVGLFWSDILFPLKKYSFLWFILFIISLVWLELSHLHLTETIVWRTLITNQNKAAAYVVDNAKYGDRIISSGDGTRFLIRLLGLEKGLQTINGAAKICTESVQDSTEWAILDYGPQNPLRLQEISPPNWSPVSSFPGMTEPIYVYRNNTNTEELVLTDDNHIKNHCARFLIPGKNQVVILATPVIKNSVCPPEKDLRINLQVNPLKVASSIVISQQQIKSQSGIEQRYELVFNQQRINQPIYFHFDAPDNVEFKVNRIEITNLEDR